MPRITYPKTSNVAQNEAAKSNVSVNTAPKSNVLINTAANSRAAHRVVERLKREKLYACTTVGGANLLTVGFKDKSKIKTDLKTAKQKLDRANKHASSSNVEKKHIDTLSAGLSKLSFYIDTGKNREQDPKLTLPPIKT